MPWSLNLIRQISSIWQINLHLISLAAHYPKRDDHLGIEQIRVVLARGERLERRAGADEGAHDGIVVTMHDTSANTNIQQLAAQHCKTHGIVKAKQVESSG